jgi:hypothetical protein
MARVESDGIHWEHYILSCFAPSVRLIPMKATLSLQGIDEATQSSAHRGKKGAGQHLEGVLLCLHKHPECQLFVEPRVLIPGGEQGRSQVERQ